MSPFSKKYLTITCLIILSVAGLTITDSDITIFDLKANYPNALFKSVSPQKFLILREQFFGPKSEHPAKYQPKTYHIKNALKQIKPRPYSDPWIDSSESESLPDRALGPKANDSSELNTDTTGGKTEQQDNEANSSSPQDSAYTEFLKAEGGEKSQTSPADRTHTYFASFITDVSNTNADLDELAVVIFVAVGIVVVGAFIITAGKVIYDIIFKRKYFPLWREIGLSGMISGETINRNKSSTYLEETDFLSILFGLGLEKELLGIGVRAELGYIHLRIENELDPKEFFNAKGFYFLFGPIMRFGDKKPFSLNLEFLNGTSNDTSIGWLSKAMISGRIKTRRHLYYGLQIGAIYMKLSQLDGLLIKNREINREFNLLMGIETGYEF